MTSIEELAERVKRDNPGPWLYDSTDTCIYDDFGTTVVEAPFSPDVAELIVQLANERLGVAPRRQT